MELILKPQSCRGGFGWINLIDAHLFFVVNTVLQVTHKQHTHITHHTTESNNIFK